MAIDSPDSPFRWRGTIKGSIIVRREDVIEPLACGLRWPAWVAGVPARDNLGPDAVANDGFDAATTRQPSVSCDGSGWRAYRRWPD